MIKNKYFKVLAIILLVLVVILIVMLFFMTNTSSSNDNLHEKVKSEILYLDSKILYILNNLNNITDANYYVSIQEVNENEDTSQSSETSGNKQKGNTNQEGEDSSDSSKQSQQDSGSESGNNETESGITQTSQMIPDVFSQRGNEIDWVNLEGTIQTIYSSWSVIILDLYKINANSEDIIGFSNQLDESMQFIQAKDKQSSLTSLAKLYSYLPKFLEGHSEDNKLNTIIKVKSNIINSYSLVEEGDWQKITEEVANAESNFNSLLNNVPENENSIYNVNKTYIVLKELQNSLDSQNAEIFYLKYRNLISELNVLT